MSSNKDPKKNKIYHGSYSLKHWINLLSKKNIQLPEYQRPFVWTKGEIKDLMKSFKYNYFVPSITIGAFFGDNEENDKDGEAIGNYVIDGQQRLTAVLLAYLGIFPKKNENDDNNEEDDDTFVDWSFNKLIGSSTNMEEILDKMKNYEKFKDCGITEDERKDDKFFKEHFLDFSYIVPSDKVPEKQRSFYAQVFRNINTKGKKLNDKSSRKGFYYIDKEKGELFQAKLIENNKISLGDSKSMDIDFIRYLALLSQYHKEYHKLRSQYPEEYHKEYCEDKAADNLAKGYSKRMEDYYISYLGETVGEEESGSFSKYEDIFTKDKTERDERLNHLKETIELIFGVEETKEQNCDLSKQEIDFCLFALIYFILFEKREIKREEVHDIFEKLKAKYNFYMKKDGDLDVFIYLRQRVKNAIKAINQIMNESGNNNKTADNESGNNNEKTL